MYRTLRWTVALTLAVMFVQSGWLPARRTFDSKFGSTFTNIARHYDSAKDAVFFSHWKPSDDALINIGAGIVHVLVIVLFAALTIVVGIALILILIPLGIFTFIYDWLVAHSALFASSRHVLQVVGFSLVIQMLTYIFVPENNRTSLDHGIKFVFLAVGMALVLALVVIQMAKLDLQQSFISSIVVSTPIAALFSALRRRRSAPVSFCLFLLGTAITLIAEKYAPNWASWWPRVP